MPARPVAILLAATAVALGSAVGADPPWETVAVGEGTVAVPRGWRNLDGIQPRMVVFRQGDGVGLPRVDETGAPLQAGLTVEKFVDEKRTTQQVVDGLAAGARKAPRLELVGKETVEDVALADGTAAKLLTAEFVKEGTRRSLQMKLAAKGADGTAWVASAFLVGGKESGWPTPASKYAKWLRAHLTSLTLAPGKFDPAGVRAAHADLTK